MPRRIRSEAEAPQRKRRAPVEQVVPRALRTPRPKAAYRGAITKEKVKVLPRPKPLSKPTHSTLYVERELAQQVLDLCEARGVAVDDLLRCALLNMRLQVRTYGLETLMGFGKYAGVPVETVVRCDPSYMRWFARTITSVGLAPEVADLLEEIEG